MTALMLESGQFNVTEADVETPDEPRMILTETE